jgi:hypothetical protein
MQAHGDDEQTVLTGDAVQALLPIARLRCTAFAVGPVRTGPELGRHLRGAIGWHLRYGHCPTPQTLECAACDAANPCPYRLGYDSPAAPDRLPAGGHQDWPRPFWVRVAGPEQTLHPGESFSFELVAIGAMATVLPDVVASLLTVQTSGLGREHAWFRLAMVECLSPDGQVLAKVPHRQLVKSRLPIEVCNVLVPPALEPDGAPVLLTLDFLTPVKLRMPGGVQQVPALSSVVSSLGRRTRLLAELWGEPLERVAWPEIPAWEVADVAGHMRRIERTSRSQNGTKQTLEGFVGRVTYRAVAGHALDWLQLGELLHVGSDIPFGFGQYRILSVV